MKNHIYWIDYVKVVACVLVALGHFFMSMTARIMPVNNIYNWFIQTIYYFHVPLFFICSGYLYQKFTNISCVKEWYRNILKKLLNLGIPFFVFSTITWVLKTLFSSSVNTQVDSLYQILFTNPTAPYWYLYCLFFVFLVTPVIKNLKQGYLILAISLAMKFLSIAGIKTGIYALSTVLANEVWFVIGMSICFANIKFNGKARLGILIGTAFIVFSVLIYILEIDNDIISFILGIMACISIIYFFGGLNKRYKILDFLSKYTMPIFLMHTLCAAPVRILLIKIGIDNVIIHFILGICFTFAGPIIAEIIMKKLKYPEFIIYPNKFIKIK